MQNLGVDSGPGPTRRVFWCPRCGTLREEVTTPDGHQTNDTAPSLVNRCRDYEADLGPRQIERWVRLGIPEAIDVPAERVALPMPRVET
jgi:hypothetical protein